jgi:Tol biopolymer transport system component
VPLTINQELQGFTLSPDGEKLALLVGHEGNTHMEVYYLSSGEFRSFHGTESAAGGAWSPDSLSMILAVGQERHKLDIATGISTVAFVDPHQHGFLPARDGSYLLSSNQGILRLSPDGEKKPVTKPVGAESGQGPLSILPDAGKFLFAAFTAKRGEPQSIRMGFFDGKQPVEVMKSATIVHYADPGYLLYLAGETLVAQPFDASRGFLAGPAKPVADHVAFWGTDFVGGKFSASQNGVLAFVHGSRFPQSQLTWVDRSGKVLGTVGDPADLTNPALSPDGNRLAVSIRDPQTTYRDVWILDLQRGSRSRLTFGPGDTFNPVWSPDGSRIAYTSRRNHARDLYVRNASGTGTEELLLASDTEKAAESWSPDGTLLSFNSQVGTKAELWLLSMSDPTHKAAPFRQARLREQDSGFSPDGKFIAYRSNESGRNEMFVQSLAPNGGRWQISTKGGQEPSWRRDGKELYFICDSVLMAVDVQVKDGAVVAGLPHPLFPVPNVQQRRNRLVAAADGQKFLVVIPEQQDPGTRINIVVNWPRLLAKK